MSKYFTVRDKILTDVVHKIEKNGYKVFSLRCGISIMIRGAGRFFKRDSTGKLIWREREVIEKFEKLSPVSLYFLTEKEVWKINSVDKKNPLRIDKMCKSWLLPNEIESWEEKEKLKDSKIESPQDQEFKK